jgi:hypothetical protein
MSALPFHRLGEIFAPLAQLLASGGDTRLHLDAGTQLNGYGCRPYPRPEAFTFASSTATSISARAYAAAEAARDDLVRAALHHGLDRAVASFVEGLRHELAELLGLAELGVEIVFSPSGTDGALHALFIARTVLGTPLTSIVAAADETGSGVAFASGGRHFNTLTAHGTAVEKGQPIVGLAEDVAVIAVTLRQDGRARSRREMDEAVLAAVAQAVASGSRVLLHAMDQSKLGTRCPSLDCLAAIGTRFGASVQIVIDACQMRLSRSRLAWHLAQGHMVQITGSKFFTGPPFSGALLVPRALGLRLAAAPGLRPALADYTSRSDWPLAWPGIRMSLPERANLGQLLRWVAAAREMRDYFAVPAAFRRRALADFADAVSGLIAAAPSLELLPDVERLRGPADADDEEMSVRTIFPFRLRRAGRALSLANCTTIYRALNTDVTAVLPADLSAAQRSLAAQLCHIGQPVDLPDGAALRLNAGARIVSESWSPAGEATSLGNLQGEVAQVRIILDKTELLLPHLDALARAAEERKDAAA